MSKKKSASTKAGILACKNIITRTDIKKKGKIIVKKKTSGVIQFQRKTPSGYGRSTIDFDGKEVEVENSKIRCV